MPESISEPAIRKQLALVVAFAALCGCGTKYGVPVWEGESFSMNRMVRDVEREVAADDFTRRVILAQAREFHEAAKRRGCRLERLTIAPTKEDLLSILRVSSCAAGLPARYKAEYENMRGAQVVIFQRRATVLLKLGKNVETVSLSGDGETADVFKADGLPYRLSAFGLSSLGPDRDAITFWVVGNERPSEENARHVLERLLDLSGMSSGSVVLRRDYFFGTTLGPVVDILRTPTFDYASTTGEPRDAICSKGRSGDRCSTGSDYCPPRDGRPRAHQ